MIVLPKNNRMMKLLTKRASIIENFGADSAKKIMQRISEMKQSENLYVLSILPGTGFHLLHGDRRGQWALKINANRRMIIISTDYHPTENYGGVEHLKTITSVTIEELCIDYH